jgi:ABC-type transporter Mla MlaB component
MNTNMPVQPSIFVRGSLTMATSGHWFKTILTSQFASGREIYIDLSDVNEVDSSALAFLTSVKRLMSAKGFEIKWTNVPNLLHNVASIYEAEELLV